MANLASIGAAVIGTGFIGTVHVEALRRIGVNVRGVLGSTPERGAARADALGVPNAYASLDDLLADDRVKVVHVTSPNDLHVPQAAGRADGRQARRVREAARACRPTSRPSSWRSRPRPGSSTPRTSTSATTRSTSTCTSSSRTAASVEVRLVTGPLLPGLAAPRQRLELAAAAGSGRRAAGGRRHRLALARPDDLRDRPARDVGHGRSDHLHRHAPRTDRPGRDVLDRPLRRDRRARHRDRGHRCHPAALRRRRAGRREHLPDQPRPEELARLRDRRVRRSVVVGLASSPTRRGSAIASDPTRSSSATRP